MISVDEPKIKQNNEIKMNKKPCFLFSNGLKVSNFQKNHTII